MRIEHRCRITKVDNPIQLVASHCRPLRDSTNQERFNRENRPLLAPSIDPLFDRGAILSIKLVQDLGQASRRPLLPGSNRNSERMRSMPQFDFVSELP